MCKISLDPLSKLENKIVKVNSVFYEKGIALVTVFPEMNEETVLVRNLEEIPISPCHARLYSSNIKNYYDFLKILAHISDSEEFTMGIFNNDVSSSKIDGVCCKNEYESIKTTIYFYGKISEKTCHCSCLRFADDSIKLCRHLISSFNQLALNYDYLEIPFHGRTRNNKLYNAIINFISYVSFDQLDAILDDLDSNTSELLKIYLNTKVDLKN